MGPGAWQTAMLGQTHLKGSSGVGHREGPVGAGEAAFRPQMLSHTPEPDDVLRDDVFYGV